MSEDKQFQRKYQRCDLSSPLIVKRTRDKTDIAYGVINNLSAGGLSIQTDRFLVVKNEYFFEFSLPNNKHFSILGKVMWQQKDLVFGTIFHGIKFENIGFVNRWRINAFVKKHNIIEEKGVNALNYVNSEVKQFLLDLAAKKSAPGGGSAAALVGATGIALLSMSANFTLGKKGYEDVQKEIAELNSKLVKLRAELERMIDFDVMVYGKVREAYALPKTNADETKKREHEIQKALSESMKVPKIVHDCCFKGIQIAARLVLISNKNLITDVGCGVLFLNSAMVAARYNVEVNLKGLVDNKVVSEMFIELEETAKDAEQLSRQTTAQVERVLA
ncbi:MAG: cyclodeaminase/cyclohydrolase family protein [Elusimicrobiota bacterium]